MTEKTKMRDRILKEAERILDIEAKALEMAGDSLDERFVEAVEILNNANGRVIVTGVGKSGIIAQKIASTMRSLGISSVFMHPVEAFHGDLGLVLENDVVIMLSNSGETSEMINLVPHVKRQGSSVIAMTGNMDSTLASIADAAVNSAVKKEACPLNLAPTASTTVMLGMGDALALTLAELKGFNAEVYKRYHPGGSLGLKLLKVEEIMKKGSELPVIKPDKSVTEAVSVISAMGMGVVIACDEEMKLMGIITDGDVRRHIQNGLDFSSTSVEKAMTVNPACVTERTLVEEALNIMETKKITSLVVRNNEDRVTGLVHLHHILKTKMV
jgi:arabinose-5-phosphate isomerase